jgi:hypothetical protein
LKIPDLENYTRDIVLNLDMAKKDFVIALFKGKHICSDCACRFIHPETFGR